MALGGAVAAGQSDLDRARQLHERTNYDASLQILLPLAKEAGADQIGEVHLLIGRNYFMLGEYKKAGDAFERAIAASPNKSEYYHWLGKAFGRRAETSNPLSAPVYASKARQHFERAVALDSRNIEAINDLFSYYVEAPGFLGGGLDKAAALTPKIKAVDPVEYHYAEATIAEHKKEWNNAEEHFRRAAELAPRQVGRLIDLARFLSKQGRLNESDAVFAQAEKVAPNNPRILFERASSYIRNKQNLDTARTLLEKYIKSSLGPEDPSRAEAQKLLKQAGA